MEPLEIARAFVDERFPLASGAVVAGSTAAGTRTATSDIDLLLIGPEEMLEGALSLACSHEFAGEAVEVFAYTEEGFETWAARGVEQHRPVIVDMLVHGTPIRDGALLGRLRDRWQPVLQAGPVPDAHRDDLLRYAVTDLTDDLRDAEDAFERHAIMALLLEQIGALVLLSNGRWLGAGKHLVRRLRELSPDRAAALASPLVAGDAAAFADAAERELERAGGRLREGFVR